MNDPEFSDRKAELDRLLAIADKRAAIAFGSELWRQFCKRRLLAMRDFDELQPILLVKRHPAYGCHFAFEDFALPEHDFRIGDGPLLRPDAGLTRDYAIEVIIELLVKNGGQYSRQEARNVVLRRHGLTDDPSNMMGWAARKLSEDGIIFDRAHEPVDYVFTELGRKTHMKG